jgi:ArsR family transcriptional regulator, arsenate/arsenite/antimonite-responsive transcriptional repressor
MFKALSNPQRLKIFLKLCNCCGGKSSCEASEEGIRRCVGDLGEDLDLAASTVSHHIKELRQAGLLHVERQGQRMECWVSEEALEILTAFFCSARDRAD